MHFLEHLADGSLAEPRDFFGLAGGRPQLQSYFSIFRVAVVRGLRGEGMLPPLAVAALRLTCRSPVCAACVLRSIEKHKQTVTVPAHRKLRRLPKLPVRGGCPPRTKCLGESTSTGSEGARRAHGGFGESTSNGLGLFLAASKHSG